MRCGVPEIVIVNVIRVIEHYLSLTLHHHLAVHGKQARFHVAHLYENIISEEATVMDMQHASSICLANCDLSHFIHCVLVSLLTAQIHWGA